MTEIIEAELMWSQIAQLAKNISQLVTSSDPTSVNVQELYLYTTQIYRTTIVLKKITCNEKPSTSPTIIGTNSTEWTIGPQIGPLVAIPKVVIQTSNNVGYAPIPVGVNNVEGSGEDAIRSNSSTYNHQFKYNQQPLNNKQHNIKATNTNNNSQHSHQYIGDHTTTNDSRAYNSFSDSVNPLLAFTSPQHYSPPILNANNNINMNNNNNNQYYGFSQYQTLNDLSQSSSPNSSQNQLTTQHSSIQNLQSPPLTHSQSGINNSHRSPSSSPPHPLNCTSTPNFDHLNLLNTSNNNNITPLNMNMNMNMNINMNNNIYIQDFTSDPKLKLQPDYEITSMNLQKPIRKRRTSKNKHLSNPSLSSSSEKKEDSQHTIDSSRNNIPQNSHWDEIIQNVSRSISPTFSNNESNPSCSPSSSSSSLSSSSSSSSSSPPSSQSDNTSFKFQPLFNPFSEKRKRKKLPQLDNGVRRCNVCFDSDTPEWRKGPLGNHTLCNACGIIYSKRMNTERIRLEQEGASSDFIETFLNEFKFCILKDIEKTRKPILQKNFSPPVCTQ